METRDIKVSDPYMNALGADLTFRLSCKQRAKLIEQLFTFEVAREFSELALRNFPVALQTELELRSLGK